jgi:hypothetical protein
MSGKRFGEWSISDALRECGLIDPLPGTAQYCVKQELDRRADTAQADDAETVRALEDAAREINNLLQPNYKTYYGEDNGQRVTLDLDGDVFGIALTNLDDALSVLSRLSAGKGEPK